MTRQGYMKLSDAQLVQEYRNGYSPALEVLVKRHRTDLLKYIGKIAGRSLAEDVLQDTWVVVITAILNGSYKEEQHFERWIKQIAHSKAVDIWRREHRFNREGELPDAADEAQNEEELLMIMETEAGLLDGFKKLSKREKRVVLQHLWGRGFKEIAGKLGIKSVNSTRSIYFRALRKIAAFL